MKHYVELRLLAPSERQDLCSRILTTVHGINLQQSAADRLAVTFPGWVAPVVKERGGVVAGEPGSMIRVFGSPAALQALLESPLVRAGAACGVLMASALQETPPVHGWVRFVRDRTGEKVRSPSAERRRARRAASRGDSAAASGDAAVAGTQAYEPSKGRRASAPRGYLVFNYRSQSTGQEFGFRVRKESVNAENAAPLSAVSSFGLAAGPGGVPWF